MNKLTIGLLLIVVLLVSGCVKEISPACKQKVEGLIPDKMRLHRVDCLTYGDVWNVIDFAWKDGTLNPLTTIMLIEYKKGSKKGENINLYYPSHLYKDGSLTYSKRVVDEQGNILGDNNFKVKLILKPIPDSESTYQATPTVVCDTLDFEIMDYEITSCNLIN